MVTLARPGLVTPLGPGLSNRPGEGGAAGEAEGEFGLLPTTPPICTIHTCQGLLVMMLMGEMFLKIPED